MKDSQLGKLSVKELKDLRKRVDKMILHKFDEDRTSLRETFKKMAADKGFTWAEFAGVAKVAKRRGSVAVKYIDPADASNTWTGRGRMPKWMAAKLKSGSKRDDFAV